MPRPRRIQFPGALYHVMARGNHKASIFEDEADRRAFFDLLGRAAQRYDLRIYAACLMGNHYHVVGDTPRGNVSDIMRFVNGVYAQSSNRRRGRTGHLFEGRFRSLLVQREAYLKRVVRYVVLNPVRARLVEHAATWEWSTYRATAGLESPPKWLFLDWLLWAFGTASWEEAGERYQLYVNQPVARVSRVDTQAVALGGRSFRQRMADVARARKPGRPLPRGYRAASRPALADVLSSGGWGNCSGIRQEIYAAHAVHGYRQSEIARFLGVDPSTISKVVGRNLSADSAT